MVEFKAVEDRWPHEARADYPELNTAIRRTDSDGRVWIIARCMNASIANRIACALNNCGWTPRTGLPAVPWRTGNEYARPHR